MLATIWQFPYTPLCNLCVLCASVVGLTGRKNHRGTENTEVAQRRQRGTKDTNVLEPSFTIRLCVFASVWLFGVDRQKSHMLFAVGVDAVTLDHPVKRAAVDAKDLSSSRAIATSDFEDIKQIASFQFIEGW